MTASKYQEDIMAEGPPVPRMREGLPNTPVERLQELCLAVVVRGLLDDDVDMVVGTDQDWFVALCRVVGLGTDATDALRVAYCRNDLDLDALAPWALHRPRFRDGDVRSEGSPIWGAWPSVESKVLRR